jgi:hypothetical protein
MDITRLRIAVWINASAGATVLAAMLDVSGITPVRGDT